VIVELKNIAKHYHMNGRQVKALDNVSFSIKQGEYLAIIGSSGSGKSTLMNVLGALDRPSSGQYFLEGNDVARFDDNRLAHVRNKLIGFIFQNFNLMAHLTALENVIQPLVFRSIPYRTRVDMAVQMLEKVGLSNRTDHFPSQLSGGQRQRVAIARALVTDPTILIADEPTGNLDPITTVEIMKLFDELNDNGRTILMVTHDPKIAAHSTRQIGLEHGMVVFDRMN